jgi:uncharacterized RDD family membrane protein YckC/uncharacterized membrane protein SpoIIM required for sporulation
MADRAPTAARLDVDRRARLWTPERVPLTVPLAGLGERGLAYGVDLGVFLGALLATLFVYNFWGDLEQDLGTITRFGVIGLVVAVLAMVVLYDVGFELFGDGRTPGKRLLQLRVVRADGRSPDVLSSLLRNLARIVDVVPIGYGVGIASLFLTGSRRLGDLLAGTFVVAERARDVDPLAVCRAIARPDPSPLPAALDDDESLRALDVVVRTAHLDATLAGHLCARALSRIDASRAAATPKEQARAVLASLLLARAAQPGTALAEVATLAHAAASLGACLRTLPRARTLDEVDRTDDVLRHAASVLLRATRKGVPDRFLEPLSLVLLDAERARGARGRERTSFVRFLWEDVPRAVYVERALVARAAAILALGAVLGLLTALLDGELGRALVGDDLAIEVERGARWTDRIAQGGTFATAALQIIANNVGVGLRIFITGLLGGVATVLGLLGNGVQIGATLGYALRLDTAGTLLRFIATHGPVELSMISLAGAAGLCLGRAILRPGPRTRLEALRVEGATGGKLVLAASLGFICIGSVEGFVSPGQLLPPGVDLAVGLALLGLYASWVVTQGRRVPDRSRRA